MGFLSTTKALAPVEAGFDDEPTGGAVSSRDKTALSFNDGTLTLTVSIVAPYTDYRIFSDGVELNISETKTVAITDVEGLHFIYFDGTGTLQHVTGFDIALLTRYCFVSVLYWDAANNTAIYFGDERHGRVMDSVTHLYEHLSEGARYISGLALGNMSTDGSGALAAHAQVSVGNGVIADEDLLFDITDDDLQDLSTVAEIPLFYRSGATGVWRLIPATSYPLTTTGTGRAAYNEYTGATWQLSEVTSTDYTLTHLFATNNLLAPIIGVIGQGDYTTLTNARAAAETEINSLLFGGMSALTPEFTPIATLIWQTSNGYANAVKSRIRTTDTGADYIDWRTANVSRDGISGVTDHGLLSGLSDDDHTQYLLLAGRAPKQSILGKTWVYPSVAGFDPSLSDETRALFVIRSNVTTEITFGCSETAPSYSTWIQTMQDPSVGVAAWPLCLQPLGGHLGIRTLAPDAEVHLKESKNAALSYKVENLNTGTTAQARFHAVSDVNDCIFGVTGSGNTDFGAPYSGCSFFYSGANKPMVFATNSVIALEIQGDGDVNIVYGDLLLASAAIINFASADVTLTHSSGQLALAGIFDITSTSTALYVTRTVAGNGANTNAMALSRNNTSASANDQVQFLLRLKDTAGAYVNCGGIAARITDITANSNPGYGSKASIIFSTKAAGSQYEAEVMRLTDTGFLCIKDGVTAPSGNITGMAQIFIDTSDGDLKIRYSDGTVKTIVVDT